MSRGGKRLVLRNTAWNGAGIVVQTAVGFLLAPFLIHRLGDTTYGLWVVLGSLTSYFGLLDLGVRPSVGRHVAFHCTRQDQIRVNETLSTAVVLLCGVGLLALAGVAAASLPFFDVFDVPAEQAGAVRTALLLVGVSLAVSLLSGAFDAALWGCQRFDLLNAVDILTTILRAALTVWAIGSGGGLDALALVTLATTALAGAAKAILSYHELPRLRLGVAHVTRRALKELFGYGVWSFLASVARLTRAQMGPLLIGSLLGMALVTPYAVANRLVGYIAAVLIAVTGVLAPFATALHASGDNDSSQRLLLTASRYSCVLTLTLTALLVLLGRPFVALWVGPEMLVALPLLLVFCFGELLPGTQYVSRAMLNAAAEHRVLAYLGLAEVVAVVALAALLVGPLGVLGICLALVLPGIFCRGVAPLLLACRLTRLSVRRYVLDTILPALACTLPPSVVLAVVASRAPPTTWAALFLYAIGFSAACAAGSALLPGGRLPGRLGVRLAELGGEAVR